MLAKQRHQYLSVLGIEQYIPRFSLGGAHSSNRLQEGDLEPIDHAKIIAAPVTQTKVTPTKATATQAVAVSQVAKTADDATSETARGKVEFTLSVWCINPGCFVLDSRQPGTALPTNRLLQNILYAMGYPLEQLPPGETIRWPIFNNHQWVNDVEQACAMVQAFISAKAKKVPLQKIILMGKAACHFALGDSTHHDKDTDGNTADYFDSVCGSQVESPLWQAPVTIIPSLDAMLQDPRQKALAWKGLKNMPAR